MAADPDASGRRLTRLADLVEAGLLPASAAAALAPVAARYAVALTPDIAALIDRDDPEDPIARQFVPSLAELVHDPSERADPIGDAAFSPVEGIVHRYPDRVLLKLLHSCPVYCRFCFRRESVGPGAPTTLSAAGLGAALGYIADHSDIWEVILTGGDPLMLPPAQVSRVMAALAAIDHVRVVRWHSRVPVVDPGRVTPALVEAMGRSGKAVHVAIHANHPREFSPAARAAIARLADAGFVLISQSVLLAGVNDNVATLSALMRSFVENRIRPYNLNHGDLAPGTGHLRVPIAEGQRLVRQLRGALSGLCQPNYVLDIPGGHGKSPIGPVYLRPEGDGATLSVEDYRGRWHAYPPPPGPALAPRPPGTVPDPGAVGGLRQDDARRDADDAN